MWAYSGAEDEPPIEIVVLNSPVRCPGRVQWLYWGVKCLIFKYGTEPGSLKGWDSPLRGSLCNYQDEMFGFFRTILDRSHASPRAKDLENVIQKDIELAEIFNVKIIMKINHGNLSATCTQNLDRRWLLLPDSLCWEICQIWIFHCPLVCKENFSRHRWQQKGAQIRITSSLWRKSLKGK